MNQHDNIAASLKHLVLLSFFGPANFLGVGARFVFFGLGEHGCEWTLALGFYGTGLERVLERYGTRSGTGSKNGGIQNQMQMPMQLEVGTGFLPPITIWCGCTSGGVPKEITPSSSDLGRFDPVHLRSCLQDGRPIM